MKNAACVKWVVRFCLGSIFFLGSGCAGLNSRVKLSHTPVQSIESISGAEKVEISVIVDDERKTRNKKFLGRKINGYGNPSATVLAKQDVATFLKEALEAELSTRGFIPNEGGSIKLKVKMHRLANRFELGLFTGRSKAEMEITAIVLNSEDSELFNKKFDGYSPNKKIFFATGYNAKRTLNLALSDVLSAMFTDDEFLSALLAGNP